MDQTESSDTSLSLISQVRSSQPEAWERLSQLYVPLTLRWCQKAGLQDADAHDIVQKVFLTVHQKIAGFQRKTARSTFRGWLWTITQNEVRMHFRRRLAHPQATGGTDAQQIMGQIPSVFEEESPPSEPASEQHVVYQALDMIKTDFTPSTWQAFWRTTVDSQSAPDVAEELQISPAAVRQAKHRVLVRLREFLADE